MSCDKATNLQSWRIFTISYKHMGKIDWYNVSKAIINHPYGLMSYSKNAKTGDCWLLYQNENVLHVDPQSFFPLVPQKRKLRSHAQPPDAAVAATPGEGGSGESLRGSTWQCSLKTLGFGDGFWQISPTKINWFEGKNRNPWVFPHPNKKQLACKLVHNNSKQMRIVSQPLYGDMIWYILARKYSLKNICQ